VERLGHRAGNQSCPQTYYNSLWVAILCFGTQWLRRKAQSKPPKKYLAVQRDPNSTELVYVFIDIMDGTDEHDIEGITGLPKYRCSEIYELYRKIKRIKLYTCLLSGW
jgi:hypothetical protein